MMKRLWILRLLSGQVLGLLFLGLAACGTSTTRQPESEPPDPGPTKASLPDPSTGSRRSLGPAPELTNEVWLNVDAPLRLADLRGKVVALEMWTFG
jgi:hypothetical protein